MRPPASLDRRDARRRLAAWIDTNRHVLDVRPQRWRRCDTPVSCGPVHTTNGKSRSAVTASLGECTEHGVTRRWVRRRRCHALRSPAPTLQWVGRRAARDGEAILANRRHRSRARPALRHSVSLDVNRVATDVQQVGVGKELDAKARGLERLEPNVGAANEHSGRRVGLLDDAGGLASLAASRRLQLGAVPDAE